MNRDSVQKLYARLESLVDKLPGGLQKPILSEMVPIRELFLEQRPARVMVVGGSAATSVPALLHFLTGVPVETGEADHGWRSYQVRDRGAIEVLDARAETPDAVVTEAFERARPDAVVFLRGGSDTAEAFEGAFARAVDRVQVADGPGTRRPILVGLGQALAGEAELTRFRVLLNANRELAPRDPRVFATEADQAGKVAEALCAGLPNAAKLEFARLTGARAAQAEIASSLLKSFTAVCGVIGVQPIPLADLPILTTLQSLMVGMIVYVSGRRASPRLIAEFAGALGVSIGAGFAFREGARALLKVFPVWGNAISGLVAGAGTYAVGRAAVAYFIEDLPLQETRKLFNRLQPGLNSFRRRALPVLERSEPEKD